MNICIEKNKNDTGREAATKGALYINYAIREKGHAAIIIATGASQFEMLNYLVKEKIEWSKVVIFHLDEYIGLPISHPASFRKYLKDRVEDKLPGVKAFNYICGDAPELENEIKRLNTLILENSIDVAFVGIGENGHLAFNDPPADFETEVPYLVVSLDEKCREQQLNEGWFSTLNDVPKKAVSMGIKQIMKSSNIICTVPDKRKAEAVAGTIDGPISNLCPASILQKHKSCHFYFDSESASLLHSNK